MTAFITMLVLLVSSSAPALCSHSSGYRFERPAVFMTTYITTESYVHHMEMDQHEEGNILFSDLHSLKTTDSNETTTIVGQATKPWYEEGVGEAARFNYITGFYQITSKEVVVVDYNNHCLRLVHRPTGQTQTLSGTCTKSGYADGSQALFYHPYSIIQDSRNQYKLLVIDSFNKAVRHVDINTRVVSTFRKIAALRYAAKITQDVSSGDIYMTTITAVYHLNYQSKELTLLAGSPTKRGYGDGDFSVSQFNYLRELLLIDNMRKLLVTDHHNNKLRILDRQTNMTYSLCTGAEGHRDGDIDSCRLHLPLSLMVSGDSLCIGEYQRIRIMLGLLHTTSMPTTITTTTPTTTPATATTPATTTTSAITPTTTQTSIPTTTTLKSISTTTLKTNMATTTTATSPCTNGNITMRLQPGQKTARVEISSGHTLQLPAGKYLHEMTSQPGNCTIHISIIKDVQQKTLTCPESLVALTSPETGLASFRLDFGDQDLSILLPPGRHQYIVNSSDEICNATLDAKDYRVRHTLEFAADYTVDCAVLNPEVTRRLLEDIAKQRYSIIDILCDSVCKRPGTDAQPVLSCDGVNGLRIRWPTDLVLTADVVNVPANIRQVLETRIKIRGLTLDVVVLGATPPIVYPTKAANGGYVSIALSTSCINGLVYSDMEDKCV